MRLIKRPFFSVFYWVPPKVGARLAMGTDFLAGSSGGAERSPIGNVGQVGRRIFRPTWKKAEYPACADAVAGSFRWLWWLFSLVLTCSFAMVILLRRSEKGLKKQPFSQIVFSKPNFPNSVFPKTMFPHIGCSQSDFSQIGQNHIFVAKCCLNFQVLWA